MRWALLIVFGVLAEFSASGQASPQSTIAPPKAKAPVVAQVGQINGAEYQKDNPLLRADLTKTSSFQGKMFETKELKLKTFSQGKDIPIVLNQTFTQTSALATGKSSWQNQAMSAPKMSDFSSKTSDIEVKRTSLGGSDVPLKMVNGFDGKPEDAKKAGGYTQMLSDGQKKYLGPESPESPSEMELIQEHLKNAETSEKVTKNQLSNEEVQKLLQPEVPLTRAK